MYRCFCQTNINAVLGVYGPHIAYSPFHVFVCTGAMWPAVAPCTDQPSRTDPSSRVGGALTIDTHSLVGWGEVRQINIPRLIRLVRTVVCCLLITSHGTSRNKSCLFALTHLVASSVECAKQTSRKGYRQQPSKKGHVQHHGYIYIDPQPMRLNRNAFAQWMVVCRRVFCTSKIGYLLNLSILIYWSI